MALTGSEAARLFRTLPRVFVEPARIRDGRAVLDEPEARHLLRVLRLRDGDPIAVLDGLGNAWIAVLADCSRASAVASLVCQVPNADASLRHVEMVVPPLKGDRMHLVLQKCAEIGVSRFHIVSFKRCVARLSTDRGRPDRYHAVLKSAAEQCGAFTVPEVQIWKDAASFLLSSLPERRYIAWEDEEHGSAGDIASGGEACVLASGPEGGLLREEVALWVKHGFRPVTLGNRILRAETAPIVLAGLALCARPGHAR